MGAEAIPYPHPQSQAVVAVMRGNRSRDTRPELLLRSALHRAGHRFRKDYFVRIPGARGVHVDVAFTRPRVAVFVDGCFWHGCPSHGHAPRSNSRYWADKLARNAARDSLVNESLSGQGWRIVRLWEHVATDEMVLEVERNLRLQRRLGSSVHGRPDPEPGD